MEYENSHYIKWFLMYYLSHCNVRSQFSFSFFAFDRIIARPLSIAFEKNEELSYKIYELEV